MQTKTVIAAISFVLCSQALAFDWSSKAIQIEQQDQAGQWVPRDPLVLNENMSYDRRGVGEPVFSVMLNTVFRNEKFDTQPELQVTCRDGTGLKATFTETNVSKPWSARFDSRCGSWRLTLVDTAKALRVSGAAPGKALSVHSNKREG